MKGERTETKSAAREDLQEGQRIDTEGDVDGDRYVATGIVINNYLFET